MLSIIPLPLKQKNRQGLFMAWRFVYQKRVRSVDNLKHQTLRSGGDGENDEVLQCERTSGEIVANDYWMSKRQPSHPLAKAYKLLAATNSAIYLTLI
jgi:hypothetical protein